MDNCDVTVIGAGLNGLVAAAYLAKAGKSVAVLARSGHGASDYSEGWFGADGHVYPTPANTLNNVPNQIIWDLELERFGLELEPRGARAVISGAFGAIVQDASPREMDRRLRGVSAREADAYRNFLRLVLRQRRYLDRFIELNDGCVPRLRDLMPLLASAGQDGLLEAARFYTASMRDTLERATDNEAIQLLFLAGALEGPFGAMGLGPFSPTGTYGLLFDPLSLQDYGSAFITERIKGGAPSMIRALKTLLGELGVTIVTDAEVSKISHAKNKLKGVALEGGQFIECPSVLCDIDIKRVAFALLDWNELPEDLVSEVATFRSRAQVAQINLQLESFPILPAVYDGFLQEGGTLHLIDSLMETEKAFDAWKEGEISPHAPIQLTCLPGNQIAKGNGGDSVHAIVRVQYVPGVLASGDWDDARKIAFIGETVKRLAHVSPGFETMLQDAALLTPVDMETGYGLIGGHHRGGEVALDQILFNRPNPRMAAGMKVKKGVEVTGLSRPLGSLYDGQPGYIAAQKILHPFDLVRSK